MDLLYSLGAWELLSSPQGLSFGVLFNPLETIRIAKFRKGLSSNTAWPQRDLSIRSLLQEIGQMVQTCWLVNSLLTLDNNDLGRPPPSKPRLLEEIQAIPDKRDSDSVFPLIDMGVPPSFISLVNDYNWSQLCLVYLRTGTLRNTSKQLPKLFQGNSLSSPI